jgi:anti-sigma regulatory factor (Ser/Thr protein kinase)
VERKGLDEMIHSIQIQNDFSELGKVNDWVREVALASGIPEREIYNLELVLEEAITNIVHYAFDDDGEHVVEVYFSFEGGRVTLRIEDPGKAFDPLGAPEPAAVKNIDDVKIGGLGIHLMKNLMDGVSYAREGGKNVLTMWKGIEVERDK